MFATRSRLALATVALAVATSPLAVLGTASAEPARGGKPARTIYLKGEEARPNVFFAFGRTTPNYEKRPVIVQRKLKSANRWNNFKVVKTNTKSKYRTRIAALNRVGIVCYRIKIKGNDTFRTSYSRRIVKDGQQVSSSQVCIRTTRG